MSRVEIYYNYTSHSGLYRGLAQNRPSTSAQAKTKTVQYNLEEREFVYRKTPKKFRAPGEDQTNNPPSSSSNHRATGGSMACKVENYLITTSAVSIWDLLIG